MMTGLGENVKAKRKDEEAHGGVMKNRLRA